MLLLDEPTDGLDPAGIKEFREMVLRLRDERGLTVLVNSHLLGEVEQMCGRFAVLKAGKKACMLESYQTVCLTSCIGKWLRRVLAKRMKWMLESMNVISPYQAGFRQNRVLRIS